MKRIIRQGDLMPRGYGFAYRLWHQDAAVFYPMPLNFLIRWSRDFYYWCAGLRGASDKREEAAWVAGRNSVLETLDKQLDRIMARRVAEGEKP